MTKIKYKLLSNLQSQPLSRSQVYSKTRTINQTHAAVKELLQCGLVSQDPVSGDLSIRPEGIQALEQETQRRRDSRRYWISTFIAFLALVIAGISLLSELGLLRLPKY